jgi:hypothetical protein
MTSHQSTTPANIPATTSVVDAADKCRWDTLNFPKCNFKLDDFASWLDSVRAQLCTRKASFLLKQRETGDDHLQEMCLLALKSSLPIAKRPTFASYQNFTDAFKALEQHYEAARRAAALSKQSELTNMFMQASETVASYIDRAAALWGALMVSCTCYRLECEDLRLRIGASVASLICPCCGLTRDSVHARSRPWWSRSW